MSHPPHHHHLAPQHGETPAVAMVAQTLGLSLLRLSAIFRLGMALGLSVCLWVATWAVLG